MFGTRSKTRDGQISSRKFLWISVLSRYQYFVFTGDGMLQANILLGLLSAGSPCKYLNIEVGQNPCPCISLIEFEPQRSRICMLRIIATLTHVAHHGNIADKDFLVLLRIRYAASVENVKTNSSQRSKATCTSNVL